MSFVIHLQFYWLHGELDMSRHELKEFLLETYDSTYPRYIEYILQMIHFTDLSNRFMDDEHDYRQRVAQSITFDQEGFIATLTLARKLWCADGPYYNQNFCKHMREFYVDELKDFVENDVNNGTSTNVNELLYTHPSGAIVTVNII